MTCLVDLTVSSDRTFEAHHLCLLQICHSRDLKNMLMFGLIDIYYVLGKKARSLVPDPGVLKRPTGSGDSSAISYLPINY